VESFNSRTRDEFLNIELFMSVSEARMLAGRYRLEYNTCRPDSSLHGRTPMEALHNGGRHDLPTGSQSHWTCKGGHVRLIIDGQSRSNGIMVDDCPQKNGGYPTRLHLISTCRVCSCLRTNLPFSEKGGFNGLS
jgi:hypothetical protein